MDNLCGVCQQQLCSCAIAQDPDWLNRLARDAGVLELDACIPPERQAAIAYYVGMASMLSARARP